MMAEICSTVLLIDDSIDDRGFFRRCLEQDEEQGYTIMEVSTGIAGLELCQQTPPDVILLNSCLPDLDELDFLRKLPQQPAIPIILLIEQEAVEVAVQARKQGVNDYLVKEHLSGDRLRCTVHNVLKQGRLQQQIAQQQATIARQLQIQKDLEESQFCLRLINAITSDRTIDLTVEQVILRVAHQIHHFYSGLRVRYCVIDASGHLQTRLSLQHPGLMNCTGMEFDLAQAPEYLAALRSHQPVIAADVFQEARLAPIANYLVQMNMSALLAIPLQHSAIELGVLSLTCDQPRTWSTREVQTFHEIADFLSFALHSVRLRQQQQLAEATLHQNEAALKEAQRVAHIGNWEFDLQTQIITWSEELYRMFGMDPSQPVPPYAEYLEKIHPDDRPHLLHCVEQAVTQGIPYLIDYRAILPDGSIRHHEGRGEVARNEIGEVVKLFGTALDITDRKQTEAALRESEEQNRAILAATPDIMAVLDTKGTYLSCSYNGFTGELICVEGMDVTGMNVTDVLPPEFAAQWLTIIPQVLRTGEMQVHEQQNRFGDRIQYEEVRMVPYQDNHILCLVRNITDRKQAELALRQREAQIAAIAANIPGGVFRFIYHSDGSYSCPFASEGYRTLLGIDPEQLKISPAQKLEMVYPDDRPIYLEALTNAISGQTNAFQGEVRYVLLTGEVKWIATNAQLQRQVNGDVIVDGIDVDITYRKKVETALRQSEAKQSALIRALPDLIMRINGAGIYLDFFTTSTFHVLGTQETMVGTHIRDTLPPDLAQRRMDAIQAALQTGELQVYEQEIWANDVLQAEECRVVVCGENEVLVIGRNITDRKHAEAKIRQSEEQLRLTLQFTGIGAWQWQPATGEYRWNGNMEQLLELPLGLDNMFQIWCDRIHADDVDRIEAAIQEALATHSTFTEEYRYQLLDGRLVWRWVKGLGIYTETGELEQVLGVVQDITAYKQTELALQQLNAELEQRVQKRTQELARSEQDLRTIFNNVYDAILIHDLDGTILDANDRALELRGATREQLLAATIPEFAAPDAPLERLPEILKRVGAGETMRFEWREKRFDDHSTFDVEVSLRRVTLGNRLVFIAGVRDISDRKQAERALRASERRYASLATAAPVAIFRFDLVLNCTYVNDQWSEMTGRPKESALGMGWVEAVYPDDRAPILAQATNNTRLLPEYVNNGEGRHLLPDGSIRWFYARVAPEMDADGKVFGLIGTLTDITARKHMEFALAESEAKFRRLVEGTNVLVWAFDENGNFTYLSPQFQTLFGWAPEEWVGQPFIELVHPDDRPMLNADYHNNLQVGQNSTHPEFRHRHRDGHYVWVSSSATPILAPDGTVIGAQGIVADISDRKQAENALRESQQFVQTVLDTVPLPMFWKDRNSVFLGCNQQLVKIMGLASSADIVGKTGFEFSPTTDEVAHYNADDQEVMTSGVAKLGIEETFTLPNGKQQWIETHKAPLRDWAGNVVGLVGMFQNITDRKQAEIALRESQRFLQTVIDTFPLVVFWKDRESVYLGCNRQSAIAAGLNSPADIIGKTDYDLPWGETEGDAYRADDRRVIESGAAKLGIIETQIRADGSRIWIETNKLPLYNLDGEVIGVLGTYQDITARKQAEEDLRAQRLRLQLALDAAQMGTWSCILTTGQLIWSDRAQAIFGFTPGTFPGDRDTFLSLVHADDRDRVIQAIAHTFETGASYDVEYRIHRLDGEVRWIAVWGIIQDLPDNDRQLIGVVCDITDRKRAEEELRQAVTTNQALLNAIPDLILLMSRDGIYHDGIPTRDMRLFIPHDELVGKSVWDILPADLAQQRLDSIEQAFQTDLPQIHEYQILINGELRYEEARCVVCRDDEAMVLVRDITDRKQAEIALNEARQFAQSIAENTPNIIYIYDLVGQQNLYTNQEIYTLLGYTSEEIRAMGSALLPSLIHPQDWHIIYNFQTEITRADDNRIFELEYRVRHRSGNWRWLLDRITLFKRDETGRVIQYIGSAQDITERKHLEDELLQMNAELEIRVEERTVDLRQAMEAAEAANRAKSAFLANMSHELRTPLNAILGFTQLMSRDRLLDAEKHQQLSIINRSGHHLLNLINDILEMSKIEAGRVYFSPNSFDLSALLDTLEAMFQVRAMEKQLHLIIRRDPSLPRYIETDENKLRQILINLIGNAIKFTPSGQVILQIHCQPTKVSDQAEPTQPGETRDELELHFAVIDTGVGIDPDELESLFEPFVQSSNRQGFQEGTGLGLPISRQFVQLMGGHLTVSSTPGVGSTFAFTLPICLADTAKWINPSLPRQVLGLAPNQPTYRILVVEDQDTNRLLLIKFMQSIGFEVQAATNGQEAIALWETWHPQLIWMDMRMPIMDGYEATRRIREQELKRNNQTISSHSPTIIIALTANAFEEDRAKILDVGCNDFIRKPYQEADLLEKISSYLGVQYLYAIEHDTVSDTPATTSGSFDAIAALQTLPADFINQLYQATIQLDSQQLAALIESIVPEQPTLAKLLMEQLNDFALEQILTLLQEVRQVP